MITAHHFVQLNNRLKDYLKALKNPDQLVQKHIDFKVEHSYRVITSSMQIAHESGFSEPDVQLAKIIALVHDIGRYQQFITYGTFDDKVSVNHAELGVNILEDNGLLHGIVEEPDRDLIIRAVLNHNLAMLGHETNGRLLVFSRLIRDADKIDIWKILTTMNVTNIILDEKPETSYTVPSSFAQCFRKREIIPSGAMSMNDYRLLRLSWIYDMNFPATFSIIHRQNYAALILEKIPPSDTKDEIAGIIHQYISNQARLPKLY